MKIKNIIASLLIFNLLNAPIFALELDTSIDDDIRRNYNPDKIEKDLSLPTLPKILNEPQNTVKPTVVQTSTQPSLSVLKQVNYAKTPRIEAKIQQKKPASKVTYQQNLPQRTSYATLIKGTKVRLRLLNNLSDRTRRGTTLSFVSTYPITTTYFTIPTGTIFYGTVAESHRPQLSGNGGLIVLNINRFVINDQEYSINSEVTKASSKKIFFNTIKGKRKYINSVFKSMKPGVNFMWKMAKVSGNLARGGSSIILSPFSLALGVLTAGGNVIISPALALFYKGDSIYFKEGCNFEIVLIQDVFIYN